MSLRPLGLSLAIALSVCVPGLAQPSGPPTLEDLLGKEDATPTAKPPEVARDQAGVPSDQSAARPQGTLVRPKDGVQHPDLDKAWAEYDSVIAKSCEGVKAAIAQQFDAVTAKGDLDAAEKWQLISEMFEKAGDLPTEKETATSVSMAIEGFRRAADDLAITYDSVVKTLTVEKKLTDAKAARDELRALLNRPAEDAPRGIPGGLVEKGAQDDGVVYVSDLPARDVFVGYGKLGVNGDMGFEGKRVSINGEHHAKSVAMVPLSKGLAKATFDIPPGQTRFESSVAINDGTIGQATPVVFRVFGDNRLLWSSRPMRGPGQVQECRVALRGAKFVTLVVECPGKNNWAHAVWIDPCFLSE